MLANLNYLPRAPVYATNLVYRTNELQFYLDLNRNGQDDPNGGVPEIGPNGGYIHPNGTEDSSSVNVVTNSHVGDPEWIGILQHPDQPYGPNNPFVARYAFIAVPIGNALDLNAIYNQVLDESGSAGSGGSVSVNPSAVLGSGNDAFLRNQGVGSWEINLAAFLADLNTNSWNNNLSGGFYQYREANTPAFANIGAAFDDARALLAYRYQNNYLTLHPASLLFPGMLTPNTGMFPFDNIDEYSDGPLQTTPAPINEVSSPPNQDQSHFAVGGRGKHQSFLRPAGIVQHQ